MEHITYKPPKIKDVESMVKDAGYCFGIRINSNPYSSIVHIIKETDTHKPALCGKRPYRSGSPFRGGFVISYVQDRVVCLNCLKALRALRERQAQS